MKIKWSHSFLLSCITILFSASSALASERAYLLEPLYVRESLVVVSSTPGCTGISGSPDESHAKKEVLVERPADKPLFIIAGNQDWDSIRAHTYAADDSTLLHVSPYLFCSQAGLEKLTQIQDPLKAAIAGSEYEDTLNTLIAIALFFISLIAHVGTWLLYISSNLLSLTLQANKFITHELVTQGWPFVLGIANLGFLLALLFIAFATTLRIESFSARRLLPRLLIAALLINFSLILTGLLIDVSRLVMAILLRSLGEGRLETLAAQILNQSSAFQLVFRNLQAGSSLTTKATFYDFPVQALEATILIWGLVAGFVVIAVGMFTRYVALLLLLIVSPIAFLAAAFPGASDTATKWWSLFVRYLLYGPIAVFVLTLLVNVIKPGEGTFAMFNFEPGDSVLSGAISMAVVVALLIAAATVGKHMSIAGSSAALGFVTKRGKQLARAPLTNPRTTAMVAAGVATGGILPAIGAGIGASLGIRGARNVSGDIQRYASDRFKKALPKGLRPIERDDKGKPKPGQQSGVSKELEKMFGTPIKRENIPHVKAAREAIKDGNINSDALKPHQLMISDVANNLSKDEISYIVENGDEKQIRVLVQNKNVVRIMKDENKTHLLSGGVSPEVARMIDRTLRTLANE